MAQEIKIGIIGGSGFYEFLKPVSQSSDGGGWKEVSVDTPYGKPSDKILISEYSGRRIAFLPRHGRQHQYPPHKINYRANLYAFKKLGVEKIIAPCAAGSLRPEIEPGHFVICDQFIDRTKNRKDTFFDGPRACPPKFSRSENFGRVAHVSMAEPYCPELRKLAMRSCQELKIPFHEKGTVVVIEGPRFATKAESNFYSKIGDVINMTQYSEVVLARELEICYLNISLVTDYDVGLKDRKDIHPHTKRGQSIEDAKIGGASPRYSVGVKPVTAQEVLRIFKKNNERVQKLILEIIKNLPEKSHCQCNQALKEAFI